MKRDNDLCGTLEPQVAAAGADSNEDAPSLDCRFYLSTCSAYDTKCHWFIVSWQNF